MLRTEQKLVLKAEQSQEQLDADVVRKFGALVEEFAGRQYLSRKQALIYLALNFYRRLLYAVTILVSSFDPAVTIILLIGQSYFYLAFIVSHDHLFKSRMRQFNETFNEFVIIATIYFVMCFVGYAMLDSEGRSYIGLVLVISQCVNFLINIAPVAVIMKLCRNLRLKVRRTRYQKHLLKK